MLKHLSVITILICSLSAFSQEKVGQNISLFNYTPDTKSNGNSFTDINSVSLYGGGSLLGILTNDPESKAQVSPSGSIGLNFSSTRASYNIYYSYNDKETIDISSISSLGSILMNPNTTGQSFSFSGVGAIHRLGGLCLSTVFVDNNWKIDSSTTVDASPILFKGGVYISPFNFNVLSENKAQFVIKMQYAHRSILGDFNNEDRSIYGVPYTRRGYNGLDLSFNFYINTIELYTQLSINDRIDPVVEGFSGTQVLLGLNLASDLIKLK